jgi:hypothetical protein
METFDPKKQLQRLLGQKRRERRKRLLKEARKPRRRRTKRVREPHRFCECGNNAVKHSTIRNYVKEGRLQEKWAARLLPRADVAPMALCIHHMVTHLAALFGEEVRSVFWEDRLTRRRGNAPAMHAARRCAGLNRWNSPCGGAAQPGSLYCFAHNNPNHYSLRPKRLGKPCSKEGCTNAAVRPFAVCVFHGAKGALAAAAVRAAPYDPAAAAMRKAKAHAFRLRAAEFRNGARTAVKESFEHAERRWAREKHIVRRTGSSLYDDFRPQRARPLKSLYPG